ncbi:MAG TPA: hypothetical protein VFT96_06290 [Gemmatimonadaceae bacterium]|nr:hypothetical protein [Gemmatimonadaceae bacterium]
MTTPAPVRMVAAALALALSALAAQANPAHAQSITPEQSAAMDIAARVRQTLIAQQKRQLLGADEGGDGASLVPAFEEWKRRVLDPLVARAAACQQKMEALNQLVAYQRQRELLGLGGDDGELDARLARWTEDCLAEAYERCVARHDLGMVNTMLGLARMRELFGLATPIDALVDGCLTFELDWSLDLTLTDFWNMKARATVPVNALKGMVGSDATVEIEGPKPLLDCIRISLVGLDPRARVEDFRVQVHEPSTWETALDAAEQERGPAPFFPREALPVDEIVVQLVPGRGELRQEVTCPDMGGQFPSGGWPGSYLGMDPVQISEIAGQPSDGPAPLLPTTSRGDALTLRFRASEGEIPQGYLFAVRQYENAMPFEIHATAMLLHTPPPMPPLRSGGKRTPLRSR